MKTFNDAIVALYEEAKREAEAGQTFTAQSLKCAARRLEELAAPEPAAA